MIKSNQPLTWKQVKALIDQLPEELLEAPVYLIFSNSGTFRALPVNDWGMPGESFNEIVGQATQESYFIAERTADQIINFKNQPLLVSSSKLNSR